MKTVLAVLKKLLVIVALPVSLLVVLCASLGGCKKGEGRVCDPVHEGKTVPQTGPAPRTQPTQDTGPKARTQPTQPKIIPPICDPVHIPPPKK